jgi:hypothetical protein
VKIRKSRSKAADLKSVPVAKKRIYAVPPQEILSGGHGEKAWEAMTRPEPDREEGWLFVEEHLLADGRKQDLASRRWKYFGK